MRTRALSLALALLCSAAFATPATAQENGPRELTNAEKQLIKPVVLPELPGLEEALLETRQEYETAKKELAVKTAALEKANRDARVADARYALTLEEDLVWRYTQQTKIKVAKAKVKEADQAYAAANEKRSQLEPINRIKFSPGYSPSQELIDAREAESAAQRALNQAEIARDALVDELQSRLLPDNTEELVGKAGAFFKARVAHDALTTAEEAFTKSALAYANELRKYPPPYLSEIKVSDGSKVFYHGVWVPSSEATSGTGPDADELRTIEAGLKKDIASLSAILKANAAERDELRSRTALDTKLINNMAEIIDDHELNQKRMAALTDVSFFLADVLFTGGAGAIGTTVAGAVGEEALESLNATQFGKIMAILSGQSGAPAKLDDWLYDGASINAGDAVELSMSAGKTAALETADDLARWEVTKQAAKNLTVQGGNRSLFAVNYTKSLKQSGSASVLNSASKLIQKRIFDAGTKKSEELLYRFALDSSLRTAYINRSFLADRALIEQRKRLRISLAEVQNRLAAGDEPLSLAAIVDEPIPASVLRKGNLKIEAFFSQELTTEPLIAFGNDFVMNWSKVGGFKGTRWVGTDLSGASFDDAESEIPLVVTTAKEPLPFPSIDGDPATIVELDFANEGWRNYEQKTDTSHVVKIEGTFGDLTGFWRRGDGTLFYFRQSGTSLVSTYRSAPARFAHEIGHRNFSGTISGDTITGSLMGGVQREHSARCKRKTPEAFSFEVAEDLLTVSGVHGTRNYDTETCQTISTRTMRVSYSRVLNDDGSPKR